MHFGIGSWETISEFSVQWMGRVVLRAGFLISSLILANEKFRPLTLMLDPLFVSS